MLVCDVVIDEGVQETLTDVIVVEVEPVPLLLPPPQLTKYKDATHKKATSPLRLMTASFHFSFPGGAWSAG